MWLCSYHQKQRILAATAAKAAAAAAAAHLGQQPRVVAHEVEQTLLQQLRKAILGRGAALATNQHIDLQRQQQQQQQRGKHQRQ
jgi:hypothetical protein